MSLTDRLSFLRALPAPVRGGVARAAGGLGDRLIPCLPTALRRALARRDRRLEIVPAGPAAARLFVAAGDSREAVGDLDIAAADPLPAEATAGSKDRDQRTVLLLPADAVLTRRASLPAQVRENLPQAIGYELDRLSPFTADQVLYDYRVLPGAKGDARIAVELALCRRDSVEGWLKRLRELGSPVERIAWDGAWPRANLLPASARPRRRPLWLEPAMLLLVPVVLLAAAALLTPLWQKGQRLESLEEEVRQVRAQAVEVDELRQELERARAGSTAVLEQKWKQPRIVDLLRELTDRIPDDTWVQSLEYQNGEVQLRGESGRATALIGILEDAPGIDGVSFRSPVTQVARTGMERYNLAFAYKGEPKAASEPGSETAPSPRSQAQR